MSKNSIPEGLPPADSSGKSGDVSHDSKKNTKIEKFHDQIQSKEKEAGMADDENVRLSGEEGQKAKNVELNFLAGHQEVEKAQANFTNVTDESNSDTNQQSNTGYILDEKAGRQQDEMLQKQAAKTSQVHADSPELTGEQAKDKLSIFELETAKYNNLEQKRASSSEQPVKGPSFQDIPLLLGIPPEIAQAMAQPEALANSQGILQSSSFSVESAQISDAIARAIETLAVREVAGSTQVMTQLSRKDLPAQFAGASLTVSQTGSRIEIRFDQFSSSDNMNQARQMIEDNINRLLASLSTKNIAVEQIYIGQTRVALPEQYVAHIATLQTSIPLDELLFGKKAMQDSHDAIESIRRGQKQGLHQSSPPVNPKDSSDLK